MPAIFVPPEGRSEREGADLPGPPARHAPEVTRDATGLTAGGPGTTLDRPSARSPTQGQRIASSTASGLRAPDGRLPRGHGYPRWGRGDHFGDFSSRLDACFCDRLDTQASLSLTNLRLEEPGDEFIPSNRIERAGSCRSPASSSSSAATLRFPRRVARVVERLPLSSTGTRLPPDRLRAALVPGRLPGRRRGPPRGHRRLPRRSPPRPVENLRDRFGLRQVVMGRGPGNAPSERGREDLRPEDGLRRGPALRSSALRVPVENGPVVPTLFDRSDPAEISSDRFPGERRRPPLARPGRFLLRRPAQHPERRRNREDLLRSTEEKTKLSPRPSAASAGPHRAPGREDRGRVQDGEALPHRNHRHFLRLPPQRGLPLRRTGPRRPPHRPHRRRTGRTPSGAGRGRRAGSRRGRGRHSGGS